VNKGLEVIEAHLLFGIDFDRIDVVIHPTSVVHSMVEFVDGSTMVQASPPDMRLPIALGLAWPDRVPDVAPPCDWTAPTTWEFLPLDRETFPAVDLARRAGRFARTAPAVFNAANEVCVEAFVAGNLSFLEIVDTVETVVDEHVADPAAAAAVLSVDGVRSADGWARSRAAELVGAAGGGHRE
jgi:1-deoxy-D-xylulose-5-phosphate reductoisomerase